MLPKCCNLFIVNNSKGNVQHSQTILWLKEGVFGSSNSPHCCHKCQQGGEFFARAQVSSRLKSWTLNSNKGSKLCEMSGRSERQIKMRMNYDLFLDAMLW